MDDIYFTDKKGRRNGKEKKPDSDRFTESDFDDIDANPSLKKRTKNPPTPPPKKNFRVNISEEDYNRSTEIDRTPKGRRRSDIPALPQSRVPTGSRITDDTPLRHDVTSTPRKAPPPPPSRQPKSEPVAQKRKKKSGVGGKIAVGVFLLFFALIIGAFGYGYSLLGEINYDDSITKNTYVDESELYSSNSVKNILIIGSDARDYDGTVGQRSDSMILFSIDKKNRQIKLTSFLRDSYVYIPGEDYNDKLNAAFSYGGPQLTMDTIEYNFGIDIDNYVIVNFSLFTQLIDLLGGLTVDGVTENEVEYMTETVKIPNVKVGTNTFTGGAALWYCRIRYLDDDFHRTERQRKVIKAVVKKVASTDLITLTDILRQVVPNISTDIPQAELLSLGVGAALSFLRYDIVQQPIPAEGAWKYGEADGASVIFVNLEANKRIIRDFIYKKQNENEPVTVPEDVEEEYYGEYDSDYGYDYGYYY